MNTYQQEAKNSLSTEEESVGGDEYEYEYNCSDDEIVLEDVEEQEALCLIRVREKQQRKDLLEQSICPNCQQESHMPIADCALVARWLERIRNESSGIMTFDPDMVLNGIRRRMDDFASFHNISLTDAAQWLRQHRWNEQNYVPEDTTIVGAEDANGANTTNASARILRLKDYQILRSPIEESTANNTESSSNELPFSHQEKESVEESFSCGICFDEGLNQDEIMHMSCAHVYCRVCWLHFLTTTMQSHVNPLGATCPEHGCWVVISDEEIRQVAPDLMPLYDQHQLNSFLVRHRTTLCWCPGPDCRSVAVKPPASWVSNIDNDIVVCDSCQTRFSFDRGNEVPVVEQELTQKYRKKEGLIRTCPNCEVSIQKNGGCNHMTCKCGHRFCWICLVDMSQEGHHACSRDAAGRDDLTRLRGQLVRERTRTRVLPPFDCEHVLNANLSHPLLHGQPSLDRAADVRRFCNLRLRFVAHEQSQCFAQNQCDSVKQRQETFAQTTEIKSAIDTDFLARANEILVVSRCFLKYSHAYRYYYHHEKVESPKMALFLHHQELLESFTERLSAASESALTRLDRSNVLNLQRSVERGLEALVEIQKRSTP